MTTTAQMIDAMMNAHLASSPTAREQYVMRGTLQNLVRAARTELLLEIQHSVRQVIPAFDTQE